MSYISTAVSVNDKENEFIKAFVAAITNNTGITVVVPDNYKRGFIKEKRYGRLSLNVKNNGSAYILDDDEKIVFNIMDGNNIAISKNLTLIHYCGNGVYSYRLNMEDAGILHQLGNYTINIKVYRGDNDITSTLTIEYPDAEEWYDIHIIYDTGL